jgi:hypothetical protein
MSTPNSLLSGPNDPLPRGRSGAYHAGRASAGHVLLQTSAGTLWLFTPVPGDASPSDAVEGTSRHDATSSP